jgi:hypothetical protein
MSSIVLLAQQDSVKIEKAVLLFYDSTEIAPVMNYIPTTETWEKVLNLKFKNIGQQQILSSTLEFRISHIKDQQGFPGFGLLHRHRINQDSIAVNEVRDVKLAIPRQSLCYFGQYKTEFFVFNSSTILLDSTSFTFSVTDTVYKKSNLLTSAISTGPSLFFDSILNQSGGTVQGDRFGTLFEVNKLINVYPDYVPTSVSFYILNDTSNIGVEIVPKIWAVSVDPLTNRIIIGQEVAASFVPFTIDSSVLGQLLTLPIDNGLAIFNGLSAGKYVVGFESTLQNPNGKSLLLGRDTLGERLQPLGTSFVYFGQDSIWYAMNHLPIIGLNFGNFYSMSGGPFLPTFGCNTVDLKEQRFTAPEFTVYPNPSSGIFTIENFEANQRYQVYDINGRLVETSIINGQLNLSSEPNGIYLLRVRTESGEVHSKKMVKL